MENKVNWRLGKLLDDRYKIESVLGIGGMAVVYKAYDQQQQRDVAVKVLRDDVAMDAESRRQFRKEYQAVGMLSHPNIRAVYDVVASGDTEYIVMEYVDGINLKQYMRKKVVLPWQEVLRLSTQVVRALCHAHSRGIIHMDIKPQNIMILPDGAVKIADFGIAQIEEAVASGQIADEAVGSVHYISPEQAHGEPVDARSDIYSLGVVMYEMLTGKLPFDGDTMEQVAVQQYTVIPDAPSQFNPKIPEELEDITLHAMEPDPDERYPDADEMLADLEDFARASTAFSTVPISQDEPEPASRGGGHVRGQAGDSGGQSDTPVRIVHDEVHVIRKNVPRISRAGELSKEGYARRRARANSVSTLLGFALVAVFALGLFVFVWRYWLMDIFSDTVRVTVPAFVGQNIEDVSADAELNETYDIKIVYKADPTYEKGVIMDQDPAAGSNRMVVSDGIELTLTVSSGIQMETMPANLVNMPFTEAQVQLTSMGMNVIVTRQQSGTITENYVISSDPAPGESVVSGSTVTLYVSAGPEVTYTVVPDLVGMTKSAALLALQREGLICTEDQITYASSSTVEAGLVLWQNYEPNTQIISGTQVYLTISSGPADGSASAPAAGQPAAEDVPPATNEDAPPAAG